MIITTLPFFYITSHTLICPIDLPKYCCPIIEFRRLEPGQLDDWVGSLHRREKLNLAARHFGCAKWNQCY